MSGRADAHPNTLSVAKSNYLVILDFGHGGVTADGKYTTAPAKMHKFPDGTVIYEGVINRKIGALLIDNLIKSGIDYAIVSDDITDTPLATRVQRADAIYANDRRAYYLSIHSNAGGGSGFEIFTSLGQSKSDKLANIFCEVYQKHFPKYPFRSDSTDGDADKEADFYVLRKTDCPAVLVENLFFDNKREADFLLSDEGQKQIADCITEGILSIEKLKPI